MYVHNLWSFSGGANFYVHKVLGKKKREKLRLWLKIFNLPLSVYLAPHNAIVWLPLFVVLCCLQSSELYLPHLAFSLNHHRSLSLSLCESYEIQPISYSSADHQSLFCCLCCFGLVLCDSIYLCTFGYVYEELFCGQKILSLMHFCLVAEKMWEKDIISYFFLLVLLDQAKPTEAAGLN